MRQKSRSSNFKIARSVVGCGVLLFSAFLSFFFFSSTASCRARSSLTGQGKMIEMYMPALSSTMEEGTIVQWLKEVGDKIEVGAGRCLTRGACRRARIRETP